MSPSLLIIESDPIVLDCMVTTLTEEGFSVRSISDLHLVPELIQKHRFDMFIIDQHVFEREFRAFVHLLRANTPETPVIVTTCYCQLDLVHQIKKTSPFVCLERPVDMEKLLSEIRSQFPAAQQS